jgi:DNA-binding transcriptional MerR regulator
MLPMWMAELSERSGLPVPTIKFYLREGLLPAGEATGATRARYAESHVRRLRLIRALVEVAGLGLDAVRSILTAVDNPALSLHELVGAAHTQLSAANAATPVSEEASRRVDDLVRRSRWRVAPGSAHRAALARALDTMSGLERPVSDALLDEYARAMVAVARHEVASVASDEPEVAMERAIVGTVLLEPVLLTIRRMAQEHISAGRLRRR